MWLSQNDYPDNVPGLRGLSNILTIDVCRRRPKVCLADRLISTTTFESTVPHDKIYGILGLTIESLKSEMFPRLRVDYSREWQAVFRDVVRHCIDTPNTRGFKTSLHILSIVHHTGTGWDKRQSSWIPNWGEVFRICPIAHRMYYFGFKTTYDTEPSIVDSGDDRILSLKGIVVDRIAKVYTHLLDIDEDHDPLFSVNVLRAVIKTWQAIIFNWKIAKGNRYPHLGDSFAQMITGGGGCGTGSAASTGQYFAAYWAQGFEYAKEYEEKNTKSVLPLFTTLIGPCKKDFETWLDMGDTADGEVDEAAILKAYLFNKVIDIQRTVFVTETGYIGVGPEITQVGDEVCVLYGGKVPFVVQKVKKGSSCPEWLDLDPESSTSSVDKLKVSLKSWNPFKKRTSEAYANGTPQPARNSTANSLPRSDCYRLVGEGYVEGLQMGEAIDLRDKGDLHEKVLHLV